MKICKINKQYLLGLLVLLIGCIPEIDVPVPISGTADFSNYVAVGNSLTAGYSDNGLYAEGQQQSYLNLIAQQMYEITPSEFLQPEIPGNGSGYLYVTSLDLSSNPPDIQLGLYEPDENWLTQIEGPFNNLGVPGIRVKDMDYAGYGSSPQANPYFYRMLGGKSSNTTYLDLVDESNPTFFTCWMGNNDVLGYATSGGAFGIDGIPGTGLGGLTDPDTEFRPMFDALVSSLTANGAKGVLLTIPDVTQIPFFTTVPWNGLELDANLAELANQFYAYSIDTAVQRQVEVEVISGAATKQVYDVAYQQALDGSVSELEAAAIAAAFVASTEGQSEIDIANDLISASYYGLLEDQRENHPLYPIIEENTNNIIALLNMIGLIPTFEAGANPFVIEVPVSISNPLGIRQMKSGELILLTALLDGQLSGTNALFPKADQYIFTTEEVKNVRVYTEAYNDIISQYATSADIGLVDADDALEEINNTIFMDGVSLNGDFITGGAFSLDAIHLTPRGYAFVANKIIETINKDFNARLSPVNINNQRAVILP